MPKNIFRIIFHVVLLTALPGCFFSNGAGHSETASGTSASAPGPSGNGAGYGGGDPEFSAAVQDTFAMFRTLATFVGVSTSATPALCPLPRLTLAQQQDCAQMIFDVLTQTRLPDDPTALLVPSPDAVYVSNVDGRPMEVMAVTPFGRAGTITANRALFLGMKRAERLTQLLHELGHKRPNELGAALVAGEHFVTDNQAYKSYAFEGGGRAALDDMGAGGTMLAERVGVLMQDPPPIPREIAPGALCPFIAPRDDGAFFALGAWVDTTHSVPEAAGWPASVQPFSAAVTPAFSVAMAQAAALALLTSEPARRQRIRGFYQKYLYRLPVESEEQTMLSHLANDGMGESNIAAILIGDPGYASARGIDASDTTGWFQAVYNDLLGRAPAPAEIAIVTAALVGSGGNRVATVKQQFFESLEGKSVFVAECYRDLLGRAPLPIEMGAFASLYDGSNEESFRSHFFVAGYVALQRVRFTRYAAKYCH